MMMVNSGGLVVGSGAISSGHIVGILASGSIASGQIKGYWRDPIFPPPELYLCRPFPLSGDIPLMDEREKELAKVHFESYLEVTKRINLKPLEEPQKKINFREFL